MSLSGFRGCKFILSSFNTFCSSTLILYNSNFVNFVILNTFAKLKPAHVFDSVYLVPYSGKVWRGNVWQIDLFQAFSEKKFGELIDQPIDY